MDILHFKPYKIATYSRAIISAEIIAYNVRILRDISQSFNNFKNLNWSLFSGVVPSKHCSAISANGFVTFDCSIEIAPKDASNKIIIKDMEYIRRIIPKIQRQNKISQYLGKICCFFTYAPNVCNRAFSFCVNMSVFMVIFQFYNLGILVAVLSE